MSSTRRLLLALGVIALALLGTLELFSFLLSRFHLLPVSETPRFYASDNGLEETETDWRTEQDPWGAWHKADIVGTGQKPCFRARYRTNGIGARDQEFPLHDASSRILLLGDSFAEGYGVDDPDIAAALIEKSTGRQVLNFGAAGDLGPLQYRILYQQLAAQYDHDTLLVFFLPANDFTDNDYAFWTSTGENLIGTGKAERWRPYSRLLADGSYETFYPPAAVRRGAWSSVTHDPFWLRRFVRDHFWSANVWRSVKLLLLSRRITAAQGGGAQGQAFSGYFDVPAARQKAALHEMESLVRTTRARQIVVVAIPVVSDLARIAAGADARTTPWRKKLEALSIAAPGKDYRFVDLSDSFPTQVEGLFSVCDGHWTTEGNQLAARIISNVLVHLAPRGHRHRAAPPGL